MEKLPVDKKDLSRGLFGAFLISIGLILTEKVMDQTEGQLGSKSVTPSEDIGATSMIGPIIFLVGWIIFLSTQESSTRMSGIFVLLIAFLGQMYMGWALRQSETFRKDKVGFTALVWIIFMGAWLNYAYRMSEGDRDKQMYVFGGLAIIMMSMMGYFFYRESDWNMLTGGRIPVITKDNSIFNPFVAMFPFGFSLIAVGNAIV